MSQNAVGRVLAIALRCKDKDKMTEVAEARAERDGGLGGDLAAQPDRGVTLIAAGQWQQVQQELQTNLPWYTRRANILVDAKELGPLIGSKIQLGEVVLKIEGETRPCDLMDRLHFGLKAVLKPDVRGGVHGRVIQPGMIRIGDCVSVCA